MTEKKQSISAIREIFAAASETELPALYLEYEEDSRAGVRKSDSKIPETGRGLKKRARAHGTDEGLRAQI